MFLAKEEEVAPFYLFFHPFLGALTLIFILTAYALKATGRKYQNWHYIFGGSAWITMLTSVGIAVWALELREAELGFFPQLAITFTPHYYLALGMLVVLTLQAVLGTTMYFWKFTIPALRPWHWRISQLMLLLLLSITLMGVPTAFDLMAGRTVLRILLITLTVAFLLGSGILFLSLEQRSLSGSRLRKVPIIRKFLNPLHAYQEDVYYVKFRPDEKNVKVHKSQSLLQAALRAGIPHMHICGGNARCSTCRVVVLKGVDQCLPRNARERAMADRLTLGPRIRLACQTHITGDVSIRRIVIDDQDVALTSQLLRGARPKASGHEAHAAILFADIRGFTAFAERQLPYDVIHALDRYYALMGQVIESNKGEINNYMGDGLLALFFEDEQGTAAQRAVTACQQMLVELEKLKPYFQFSYRSDFDIRMGLHYGELVIGGVGVARFRQQAAIGDAVNLASRIESVNKDTGTRFLVSEAIQQRLTKPVNIGIEHSFVPKGKSTPIKVFEILAS